MCGIVGAIAKRPVEGILLEGLRRLEYRGYDSAGIALKLENSQLSCIKSLGKVAELESRLVPENTGNLGIAHTRWATHGKPTEANAHPHLSGPIALIHNGIVENYLDLKERLLGEGYNFLSETDSEVVTHLVHSHWTKTGDMLEALKNTIAELQGAYALCVINVEDQDQIYIARKGSPLVLGVGIGEYFVASDQMALRPVTDRFIFLEEGDYGVVSQSGYQLYNDRHDETERATHHIEEDASDSHKGSYRHYMLKEIHEQPEAFKRTLEGRLGKNGILVEAFGLEAQKLFKEAQGICIVACGTSYHAGMVARYWLEKYLDIPVTVEVASEYRYRRVVIPNKTLFVTISQSGETADTLAALYKAKELSYLSYLAVCNVTSSSLVRESDLLISTNAGPEIGVASTKAFTTQLVAFLLMTCAMMQAKGISDEKIKPVELFAQLNELCRQVLSIEPIIERTSLKFADKDHALFLGRGVHYPVAMEAALKLKEISYIHAEAYPSGELKHGPLALVDENMPVIAVAPSNKLLEKLKSNLEEVKARGGQLYVFADSDAGFISDKTTHVIPMPHLPGLLEPIVYSIPLQLLAYHIAVVKGTDVDQPRNLAKSVTVE
jgi:glucosamine--fructose-6-phosphate aminotransferase (isomerizing)